MPPSFDRITSKTGYTASVTAVRQVLGGYELIEVGVSGYAQSVCQRSGSAKRLQRGVYLR